MEGAKNKLRPGHDCFERGPSPFCELARLMACLTKYFVFAGVLVLLQAEVQGKMHLAIVTGPRKRPIFNKDPVSLYDHGLIQTRSQVLFL